LFSGTIQNYQSCPNF